MNFKIRGATIDDLKGYSDLLQHVYEVAYSDDKLGLTKECFSREIFATKSTQDYLKSHLIDSSSQKTWVAVVDEKIIGTVTCIITSPTKAALTGFYVHPLFQGKGIGKKLYQLALEFSKKRDMFLDIYTHNLKTIDMYKRWGWQLDEAQGNKGYFFRHWDEWPKDLNAKCMYMKLTQI